MRQRGFTLIELMIVIVIVAIIGITAAGFAVSVGPSNAVSSSNSVSFGFNGLTEMRCIDGFKFVVGEHGQARQVMDEFGKGVRCDHGLR